MSYRNVGLILFFGALSACVLVTACTYELPEVSPGNGNGGGGEGGAGTGGATSTSGSTSGIGGAGLGGSAGAGGGMPEGWWDAEWAHRVKITFKNAGGEALTGFPVMVRLDGSRIQYAQALPNGADLRFVDADGTILSHETERWQPDKDSFVWVQVPEIDANATDYMWLYYGNPAADDIQNATEVWNDFIGVYHFSPSFSQPPQVADSTGVNPGTWGNNAPGSLVPGRIAQAIRLDGVRFVHIGENSIVAANVDDGRTVEAWVNATQAQPQAIVYEEGECVGWHLSMNANSEYRGNFITDSIEPLCDTGRKEYFTTTPATAKTWQYVTLVIDRPGGEMRLFVDGTFKSAMPIDNEGMADGNGVFRIGNDHDGGIIPAFVGNIDEVRISNNARSNGWIAAQHKSMTDAFLDFHVE